jgi:multiple sugar transport system permease protein
MTSIAETIDREGLTHDNAPWLRRLAYDLRENRVAYFMLAPSVIAFLALVLVPLVTVILGAFVRSDAVGRLQLDQGLTLENFRAMIEDPNMAGVWQQTFLFVFGSVILTVLFSFPLALILNQKFPGVTLAKALLLLPWAAPLAITSMTWRWIFHDQLGALNYLLHLTGITQENIVWLAKANLAFPVVTFVEVWSSIPFMTITFLAGLQAVPPQIYDAAKMDGANPWNEFWDMTLPQMKRVLMIVSLLSVIWAFRSFTVIWTITQGNPFYRTDVSVTYLWKVAFQNLRFGEGFAIAFTTFLVLVVFSILYTRVLRSEEMG